MSPIRRCVGLAEDCAWHEAVHELVHLSFDARHLNEEARSASPGRAAASSEAVSDSHPLRQHWQSYRARGYSERVSEELVAREHELRALTCSGAPLWRWALRALFVADSALMEAQKDLSNTPAEARTPAQAAEWRRVGRVRSYLTGPTPRLAYALLPLLGLTALASTALRRLRREPSAGDVR